MFHGVDGQQVRDLVRFMGRYGYSEIWHGALYFGGRRVEMQGGRLRMPIFG